MTGGLAGQADVNDWKRETRQRAAFKRRRQKELRRDAAKDKRRYKTRLKVFRAFITLARIPTTAGITIANICVESGISEAAFHKNFTTGANGDEPSGIDALMLVAVEEVANLAMRHLHREMIRREDSGNLVRGTDRVALAVAYLVRLITRYPRMFQVEGIVPREVILALSDALTEAIIWDEPATYQDRANANSAAKYHAAALIGIMRSGLGGDVEPEVYARRLAYVMISQIVPALLVKGEDILNQLEVTEEVIGPAS